MRTTDWVLTNGLFVDVKDDWRVLVVEADLQRPGVFYVGNYPYDAAGLALHPDAPAIVEVWDGQLPGARQVSDRQKRTDGFLARTMIAPILAWHHA